MHVVVNYVIICKIKYYLQMDFNPRTQFEDDFIQLVEVQRHYMTSGIRIVLIKPSDNTPLRSYYAIADILIEGHCACFGHADSCSPTVSIKLRTIIYT